jgi:hypothetical protein
MSAKERWLCEQVAGELQSRRITLLAEKARLQKAAARILEIDELVEMIDQRLAKEQQALDALPAEVPHAEPA